VAGDVNLGDAGSLLGEEGGREKAGEHEREARSPSRNQAHRISLLGGCGGDKKTALLQGLGAGGAGDPLM
jgi:hypothetical protein